MKRRVAQWFRSGIVVVGALALAGSLPAQDAAPPPAQQQTPTLSSGQLDNLVAPVALYPDPLIGQALAASTYPVELMEAQQWLKTVGNLSGQPLLDAARQQDWDPSVQALVAMPDVMNLLTQDIRWTTDLGNAFLAQQGDVMSAVQRMRQRAEANGQLKSNAQETVSTNYDNGQSAIDIEPADPNMMYVPAYDPYYVYGYGSYPPLYYPDGYWFEPGINIGLFYGGWGGWGYGGLGWGWRPNWFGHNIYINHGFFSRYGYRYNGLGGGRNVWVHDPGHRMGAGYPASVANRFGGPARAARINEGRSGNWHTFNGNNSNGFRGSANGFDGANGSRGNVNSFRGAGGQRPAASQQQFNESRNFEGRQSIRSQAPRQNFQSAPQRNFQQSPQRNFQSAPQRNFQSAPRAAPPSAPRSMGGGGGARSFGGGGGGARNMGGGGGSHASGGGGGSHGGGGHGRR
jgi:hypothetical protein